AKGVFPYSCAPGIVSVWHESLKSLLHMIQKRGPVMTTPFSAAGETSEFYEGLGQREALARARYLVANGRRMGLLVGVSGVGKTRLLHAFAGELREQSTPLAYLNLCGISARELVYELVLRLRARPQTSDDLPRLLRRLEDSVRESWFHGTRTVLLLDDADQALADTLTQVARLAQSEMASQGKLHLLLAAGTTQVHRLGARLLDLVDLRVDL